MAYEQRDNSGSFFANDRKTTENHPDYTGSCMVAGIEYWVSAWDKVGASGKEFTSLSFKKKEPKPDTAPQQEKPLAKKPLDAGSKRLQDMEDDIPF